MLKFILAIAFSALSCHALAQFTVSGRVQDAKTTEILVGATIQVEGESRYAISDEYGYFILPGIANGNYTLVIKFLGYTEKRETIDVTGNTELIVLVEESAQFTDEVVVLATRVTEKSPTTFSSLNKTQLQKQNFGQDLPFVLNWTPSLVTTSDAGAGVGYTGLRIRGSDATRINVTINGVPLNDSESQGMFWVDVPDIATSAQSIQIQRGVGTSTNGAGAFGASINLQTNTRNDTPYAELINSYGSFNTHRHTIGLGTGLINNKFAVDGRASLIKSDGFIDRASSDLKSYYLSGGYYGDKTIIKAIAFGGNEITYQSWYGVPESRLNNNTDAMLETASVEGWNAEQTDNLLQSNSRTFNSYTYKDQVDNYGQEHYQLHFSHRVDPSLTANAALHYTHGHGYYEEFKFDDKLSNYELPNTIIGNETIASTDLVRRRWLKNDFYGVTYSLNYDKGNINSILGGAFNQYDGDHFGELIWTQKQIDVQKDYQYYFNDGRKRDFNVYWKINYELTKRLNAFVDLQYRKITHDASGIENKQDSFTINTNLNFFNPKFGLTYELGEGQQLYGSYSLANREPVRDDFVDAPIGTQPKHETLRNLEVGWRWKTNKYLLNVNYYLMDYKNQLVMTGQLNDVGAAIRTNVDNSYRQGVEIDGGIWFNSKFYWNANLTLSQNKIQDFNEVIYDYGANFDEYNVIKKVYTNSDISLSPNVIAGSSFSFSPHKALELTILSKYVGKQFLDNTSNADRKIDSYFINDLRVTYRLHAKLLNDISISLLANNILDVAYSSNGYTYGYLGGTTEYRQNYFYPQAGRNYLMMLAIRF